MILFIAVSTLFTLVCNVSETKSYDGSPLQQRRTQITVDLKDHTFCYDRCALGFSISDIDGPNVTTLDTANAGDRQRELVNLDTGGYYSDVSSGGALKAASTGTCDVLPGGSIPPQPLR